jgi:hypothetical protein
MSGGRERRGGEARARLCARPGCSEVAEATLAFDYAQRVTWLVALAHEQHPMAYDLCHSHAQALTVPRGWRLDDRRVPA